MSIRLSHSEITSFCGHVLPLRLLADRDISHADITWASDSDAVALSAFCDECAVRDGVLLILNKIGQADVTASLDGITYTCRVTVRERRRASADEPMQYYIGDLHTHTTMIHRHEPFAERTTGLIADYLRYMKNENTMDFGVISDHGDVTNDRDFLLGFTDNEDLQPMHTVIFPGSESEVTVIEPDRFGLKHKNAGEIVVINAADYSGARSWQEFYDDFASSPLPVAFLAHPQVMGSDNNGLWNFCLHKNNTPELMRMVRAVEMGNGTDRGEQMLYEYTYSVALDNGFRVTTSGSSDAHEAPWGMAACPGKTIIMAPEKSYEMLLDALLENRAYASESGNVKLSVRVNGQNAPATLPPDSKYTFHAEFSTFREDPSAMPVQCQVISDYGLPLKVIEGEALRTLDFEIESDTARYFYLRLMDSEGRKTWSPPVWTGRPLDKYTEPRLIPIDKSTFLAFDEVSGRSAETLINENPLEAWISDCPTASVVIDMQKEHTVCAIGHFAENLKCTELRAAGIRSAELTAGFVSRYRISVSMDGENFHPCKSGILRIFGGEEIVTFPARRARFVQFDVLSTVGRESGWKQHADAGVRIGELTIFESEE